MFYIFKALRFDKNAYNFKMEKCVIKKILSDPLGEACLHFATKRSYKLGIW